MIHRDLIEIIDKYHEEGKAFIITGPRQVGKTTMLKSIGGGNKSVLWLDGDDATLRERLKNAGTSYIKSLIADHQVVVIDEAQRIQDVGLMGKQIVDHMPHIQLFITGSSAIDVASGTGESMTGRKWSFNLFPLSFREMVKHHGLLDETSLLRQRLVYGYYPDIVTRKGKEERRLKELCESYLFKDIYALENIKKPEKFERLLKSLAFQIGQQVSTNEIAQLTQLDVSTVERYIDMLEKAFVVFRVPSYLGNKRNELKKSRKIYFVDNGFRNAIINQWNPVDARHDAGALWENWLMSERRKLHNNNYAQVSMHFWRTSAQQEVDLIETTESAMNAFEIKWNTHGKGSVSRAFTNAYPEANAQCITPHNFESFLL
ncbi:MAG: ATP-binding protein [Flavobacteriales bacterium]